MSKRFQRLGVSVMGRDAIHKRGLQSCTDVISVRMSDTAHPVAHPTGWVKASSGMRRGALGRFSTPPCSRTTRDGDDAAARHSAAAHRFDCRHDKDDVVMLAHRGGLSLLDLRDMSLTPYCDPEGGRDAIIYNDIKVDRWGRVWVGTSHARELEPRGALWCVESATRFALADAGFAIANGPAFSRDGGTLYFNDSLGRTTFAYDIAPGHLAARNRRVLVHHGEGDGLPDGVVVDANDDVWTAQWAGSAILKFNREDACCNALPFHPHVTIVFWRRKSPRHPHHHRNRWQRPAIAGHAVEWQPLRARRPVPARPNPCSGCSRW